VVIVLVEREINNVDDYDCEFVATFIPSVEIVTIRHDSATTEYHDHVLSRPGAEASVRVVRRLSVYGV
jgi:hypothetical protein